ncbi:YejG family protein [Enterobacillus tribolii]|uniref:YejG-like protein n=1 Tax=Enterobacillus tribolii TaxID=1487935 RepID=A0A370R2L9_9GAMM|nr:YejG family protein [Enterobacillus tribolii]MBW7984658.1 hypothetical protein [Enterobacillus tribolii]RDK96656.1 YejG-like protein [Enterobacillus tribolii]
MNSFQLSIVHRLPQSYRWSSGFTGVKVEPVTAVTTADTDNNLIGLKLLSHEGAVARQIMRYLEQSLLEMQIDCFIVEYEGEPCLFVHLRDESAVMCRLKNVGVAIAEPVAAHYPF